MRYVAFDIETAAIPSGDGGDWTTQRPLGITCYALAWADAAQSGAVQTRVGYGQAGDGMPAARMTQAECAALVETLLRRVAAGETLLTWNGLGFDFDVLAEESGRQRDCCALASAHVDMMFHFFCRQGYPLGLDAAAKGMGLDGKPDGMDGAQAPLRWAQGDYQTVLHYVEQDVKTTLALAGAVEARKQIHWTTRSGKPSSVRVAQWLPVRQALELPLPDTSWMRTPLTRERFTGWMARGVAGVARLLLLHLIADQKCGRFFAGRPHLLVG